MDAVALISAKATDQGELFEIGDLGSFSMNEIYEALTFSGRLCTAEARHDGPLYVVDEGEDSDCSWTHNEDSGEFYFDIRRRLDEFVLAPDQTTMTTKVLSRRQRRFVHATAQVMRLGHASLGANGRNRPMIIFKDESAFRLGATKVLDQKDGLKIRNAEHSEESPPYESLPKKRRRLNRIERGFSCRYEPCKRVFDRASERTKHEQSHQRSYTNRFQCPHCDKGFRYPKDLRRHQKTHDNTDYRDSIDLLSTSLGSSAPITSTLTSDSRVPSDTSLAFNSKGNSPLLAHWPCDCVHQVDIEPLVLDETAWKPSSAYAHESFHLPFEELACFGFDENEEDILEIAKVRK